MLVVPPVVGLVAAVAIWSYLGSVQERAYDDADLVQVYVVKRPIARGAPGTEAVSQKLIATDEIPRKYRPRTALRDLGAIQGLVADADLAPGQIVGDGHFVAPRSASGTFARRIPTGQVAISIRVDEMRGVSNLIVPGDKVNILVPSPEGMRTLFQNVDVIAVGGTPVTEPSGTPPPAVGGDPGLVTFAVPPLAAEKIAMAVSIDEPIYLRLVPPDNQPVPLPPANRGNLFGGPLTPYA